MALTPVDYTPHVWANGEEGGTPINATRLNEVEAGIYDGSLSINEIIDYLQTEFSLRENQLINDTYEGRNIAEIPEIQSELDQYGSVPAFLQARAQNMDSSYLNVGDYCVVSNTHVENWEYAIYGFWTYLNIIEMPSHIIMGPRFTGSDNSFGAIQWNTSNTNNGTSSQPCPYLASNLHKEELETILPTYSTGWQNVMIERTVRLEQRYSSSGKVSASTACSNENIGKIWSLTETEVFGQSYYGTKPYADQTEIWLPYFRTAKNRMNIEHPLWLRTVGNDTQRACAINEMGSVNMGNASNTWHAMPCFMVG